MLRKDYCFESATAELNSLVQQFTQNVLCEENTLPDRIRKYIVNFLPSLPLQARRSLIQRYHGLIPAPSTSLPFPLDDNLCIHVLSYLPLDEVIGRVRLVNRTIFALTISKVFCRSIRKIHFNSFWAGSPHNWITLLHRFPQIDHLSISQDIPRQSKQPSSGRELASQSSTVREGPLKSSKATTTNGEDMSESLANGEDPSVAFIRATCHRGSFQKLQTLEMLDTIALEEATVNAIAEHFPELTTLLIRDATNLSDQTMRCIIKRMNLTHLCVPGAYQLSDSAFGCIPHLQGEKLYTLNLARSFVTNRGNWVLPMFECLITCWH